MCGFKKEGLFLSGAELDPSDIYFAIKKKLILCVSQDVESKIHESHELLQRFVEENKIIYGVNTSLGGFVNWLVPTNFAQELQENLISAVATNVGTYLEENIVKASIIARLNSLARGASAISLKNFKKLLQIYNAGIVPCVPSKGSLGASGDLGPLACIALVAVGKWKASFNGEIISGGEALNRAGIEPMQLTYKEGLSLINGTSMMVGLSSLLIEDSINLIKIYDLISCLSFEGLAAKKKPFDPTVHLQKQHPGQLVTAKNIWGILSDSKMISEEELVEKQLQVCQSDSPICTELPIEDAYSIRCTPHIIGPIRDSIKAIKQVICNELNSSSDNPLVIPEANDVFHNGHFHGQYISMAMDQLSISLTTLTNLSDRRIDRFMDKSNNNNLPAFLCAENPGLRLGLMGGQFMAASLTSENRSLCNPVSIQSLTSTGDFQDIVSLGLVAARRAKEIYENASYVIAFELMCAAQAADIRGGSSQLSTQTAWLYKKTREVVPYLSKDVSLTEYLERLSLLIRSGYLLEEYEAQFGESAF